MMARSSLCLLQLLPCALLLLILLRASIAQIKISDIAGKYALVRSVLDICADTVEINSTEITLPARSLSFDGKPCLAGSFPLTARRGHPVWDDYTNEMIGIRVTGKSLELLCQKSSLHHVGVFFTRPKADIRLKDHGFKKSYNRRKGVKYLVIQSSNGSCLYNDTSKDLSPTPNTTFSKSDNGVGVPISEIAGNYTLVQKVLNICTDTLQISRTEITLPARRLLFDGKPCLAGSFPLTARQVPMTWNDHTNEKIGLQVTGNSSKLYCQEYSLSDVSVFFTRPKADVEVKDYGFNDSYNRRKNVKYFVIQGSDGSCLYHNASSKKRGAGLSIWAWLGPVIGAGATIVGAFITAINWSRRRAEKDVQKLGIYDYEHDY